jgi:predicted metal-binding protein
MATWITVCETCKRDDWREGEERPGARLAALVEDAAAGTGLVVRRTACLMGCEHGCNLAVQGPGKLAYVLGRFAPAREAAEAVVAWARLHADSATGQVPYRDWPQGVKGHFVSRTPPLPPDPPEPPEAA